MNRIGDWGFMIGVILVFLTFGSLSFRDVFAHVGTASSGLLTVICLFLFLGADPSTDWLKDCDVAVDDRGFVTTGEDASLSLQTSVPGVFAIGDVRAGSVKRVGAAIGEGAAVVSQIHAFLARPATTVVRRRAA